jgi:uncharacterized protein DUF5752
MNHRDKRAGSPHRFVSRVELREVLGKTEMDEQRLPELIEKVLVDSLYYPPPQLLPQESLYPGAVPNDFATWVASMLRIDCSASVRSLGRNGRSSHKPCRLNARSFEPQWM